MLFRSSACNKQPWKFIIVTSAEKKANIYECYPREWMKNAPAYIVAVGNNSEAWHRPADSKDHTDIDLSIAIEHICLAATSLGLGTCWVCNFYVDKCIEALNIPNEWQPIAILPIGYPASENTQEKKRKTLEDIIAWEEF